MSRLLGVFALLLLTLLTVSASGLETELELSQPINRDAAYIQQRAQEIGLVEVRKLRRSRGGRACLKCSGFGSTHVFSCFEIESLHPFNKQFLFLDELRPFR